MINKLLFKINLINFNQRRTFTLIQNISSIMKGAQKRKTFAFDKANHQFLHQKRKHNSTANSLKESESRLVVFQIIQHLILKTFQEQNYREKIVKQTLKKLDNFNHFDSIYFKIDFQMEPQIMCHQDAEPTPEENKTLEVVKGLSILTKIGKKGILEETQEYSQNNGSSRLSIIDSDKKERETVIQKLKKEYSNILHSKYFSQSTPIGQSRPFFKQGDTPQIVNMRNNFGKPIPKIIKKHKPSHVEQLIRKNKKLNTIYKKSKDFIDTIDPTMSNSIYVSDMDGVSVSRRSSIIAQPPQDPNIIVKLSKLKEIINVIKVTNQNYPLPIDPLVKNNSKNPKLINFLTENERETLKLRVQRSFHSNSKFKFKEVAETERRERSNNAISVSFLPKIARI